MRKVFGLACACFLVLALFATTADAVGIEVAPHTINLNSKGQWVTIHINVPYDPLYLAEGRLTSTVGGTAIDVAWITEDACGDLVAKLVLADVKEVVEPGTVDVTVSGTTSFGDEFDGSSTVEVVDTPKR